MYARVSTDDPRQTSSYELQKNHYTDLVNRREDWKLVDIYADEGISGTSLKHRDSFIRMIADCKAGKIDLIVTKSVSRFARNVLDCIGYVRQLAAMSPPIGVFFETENIYTLNPNSEMSLSFISTLAQEESHNKSEIMNASIGNDSSQFLGQDYEKVVASLKESGFTNVQTQQVTTGLAKGNTVVGVTVNNVDTYNSSESFAPDVKIVVKYSSNDRVDITETLKNWQSTDYEKLVSDLKAKGFTTVKVTPKTTENKSQNRLVKGILLNDEEYVAGDCFLPKSSSIKIDYYRLLIKIGQSSKQYEKDQNYQTVVAQLASKGFTNIRLQRANDIGWFPLHAKEGTIKSISINGLKDFSETETFYFDTEIIIVVHTKKDSGCSDITEIAK